MIFWLVVGAIYATGVVVWWFLRACIVLGALIIWAIAAGVAAMFLVATGQYKREGS